MPIYYRGYLFYFLRTEKKKMGSGFFFFFFLFFPFLFFFAVETKVHWIYMGVLFSRSVLFCGRWLLCEKDAFEFSFSARRPPTAPVYVGVFGGGCKIGFLFPRIRCARRVVRLCE